jgi:hypothetical protein
MTVFLCWIIRQFDTINPSDDCTPKQTQIKQLMGFKLRNSVASVILLLVSKVYSAWFLFLSSCKSLGLKYYSYEKICSVWNEIHRLKKSKVGNWSKLICLGHPHCLDSSLIGARLATNISLLWYINQTYWKENNENKSNKLKGWFMWSLYYTNKGDNWLNSSCLTAK